MCSRRRNWAECGRQPRHWQFATDLRAIENNAKLFETERLKALPPPKS
jgi:hypothetical protein